jgi:hypothetical protein
MNSAIDRPLARRRSILAMTLGFAALIAAMAVLGFWAQRSEAAPVTKSAVLVTTEEGPWGAPSNEEAMTAAFGTEWELQNFATVQADEATGGLFASSVGFIWIEGSDESTTAAKEFVEGHEAQLKAFVARGGSLFIDAGTNEEEVKINYDGRTIGWANEEDRSDEVAAPDPSMAIFHTPFELATTEFTGDDFASGSVQGAGLTPILVSTDEGAGSAGNIVLGTYSSGLGHVVLGSMVVSEYQEPEEEAQQMRVNLVVYLKGLIAKEEAKVTPVTPAATVTTTPVAQCVVPKLRGKTLKQAKAALRKANCGLDKVAHKKSVSLKTGKVIRQSPPVGTVRGAGSEVSFRLGRG